MVYAAHHKEEKQRGAMKRFRAKNQSKWVYKRTYSINDEQITMSYRTDGKVKKLNKPQVRIATLMLLGGKCSTCGENDHRCLQIDHVNGGGCYDRLDGNKSWSIAHIWYGGLIEKYQVLCANCNWKKRYDNSESRIEEN